MAQIQIKNSSWLNFTKPLKNGEVVFWDQFDFPELDYSDNDRYLQLSQLGAKRLDLLAFDFYGDANYIWAILLANNLEYPNQAYEGLSIRLPDIETIKLYLKTK